MGHQQQGSLVFPEGPLELFLGLHVQVVGGFVQHQQVGRPLHDLAQPHLGRLAPGKGGHPGGDVVIGKPAGRQGCPDFRIAHPRIFLPQFLQGSVLVPLGAFLFEIPYGNKISLFHAAGHRGDHSQQGLQQGGFPQAVGAPDGDFLSPFQLQVHLFGERYIVPQHQVGGREHEPGRGPVLQEPEMGFGFLRPFGEKLHFVQLLLPAVGHAPGGHPGFVPGDEILFLLDFRLLPFIGCFFLAPFQGRHFLELFIVPGIPVQLQVVHMPDDVGHRIQEGHVMGNQDKGVFIILEVPGKPLDVFRIQIVGGFVQQQDVRILQQQFGQEHLGPLAPGQFVHLVFQADVPEPQTPGHFLDLGIQVVVVRRFQPFLDFSHFFHEPVHFLRGSAFHFVVIRQHLLFLFHQVLEGGA